MRLIIDIVGFQLTWWACALGAGVGRWEPGVAVGLLVVLLQLAAAKARLATLAAVFAAATVGVLAETAMITAGLIQYAASWPAQGLPPAWLIVLWMVFATCIDATTRMLGERPLLKGALLGAALAPPTYWAGARFSALTFAEPIWAPLAATATAWAIATPLMMAIYRLALPAPAATSASR